MATIVSTAIGMPQFVDVIEFTRCPGVREQDLKLVLLGHKNVGASDPS